LGNGAFQGRQVKELEAAIKEIVNADARLGLQYRAVQQIPGIKKVGAMTMSAELGELQHYGRNQLVARVGIFPKCFESGRSVRRKPRMAKGGGARLRRVLYMGATSILRSKGPLRDFAECHRARGLSDMAVIGILMRKLLLVARAVMKNNGVYDESKILR